MKSRNEISMNEMFMAFSSFMVNDDISLTMVFINGLDGARILIPYAQDVVPNENMESALSLSTEGEQINRVFCKVNEDDLGHLVPFLLNEIPTFILSGLNDELELSEGFVKKAKSYFKALTSTSENMMFSLEFNSVDGEQSISLSVGYHSETFLEDGEPLFDFLSTETFYGRNPIRDADEDDENIFIGGGESHPGLAKLFGIDLKN